MLSIFYLINKKTYLLNWDNLFEPLSGKLNSPPLDIFAYFSPFDFPHFFNLRVLSDEMRAFFQ